MATIRGHSHRLNCGCVYNGTSNQYAYCKDHKEIIQKGEERARFGQKNTQIASSPFQVPKESIPKDFQSRKVYYALLELRDFIPSLMLNREEWDRYSEIESLTRSQLRDDAGYIYARVGRKEIEPSELWEAIEEMWPSLTPDQAAIAEGLELFISLLTEVQQETLRNIFYSRFSERETAGLLNVSRDNVRVNTRRGLISLKKKLLAEWPAPEVMLDDAS